MKHYLLLIICLLLCAPAANAGWFSKGPSELEMAQERILNLENQMSTQVIAINRWQIATGSLAVACVILLVIGTALGAKTRKHYDGSRRLGATSPAKSALNGRKLHVVGKEADDGLQTSLAA
jgi:hypothetical protein